jgi:hypothetical protein
MWLANMAFNVAFVGESIFTFRSLQDTEPKLSSAFDHIIIKAGAYLLCVNPALTLEMMMACSGRPWFLVCVLPSCWNLYSPTD